MPSAMWRVCAAHRLLTARDLGLACCGLKTPGFLKLWLALQQLSQHIGDVVPQPEPKSQTGARSVERAMRASHGTAGWACKAADHEADLQALSSARRSRHQSCVGQSGLPRVPMCEKGLSLWSRF